MADENRPNLLFLMTDHQRFDSLGMVQAGIEVTPNLNRLAAESVVFNRAYNTCPMCIPARTALFTGKYPTKNGEVLNDFHGNMAQDHVPLQQLLSEVGYDIVHVGVHHIRVKPPLEERIPFVKWIANGEHSQYLDRVGIEQWDGERWREEGYKKQVLDHREGKHIKAWLSNTKVGVWPHAMDHFLDEYFIRESIDFLSQPHPRPFALFVDLWAPHPPLLVPEPYASMFPPDEIDLPSNVDVPAEGEPANRRQGIAAQLAEGVSMQEWHEVWAAHLGLVHLGDAGFGRILEALESSGHKDDTITVFTVDHGDHLGQHRMYQKFELYEQAIHMPLIFRVPGGQAAVFDAPVSHLDIMPTLLDLAGIDKPDDIDGVSMADSIRTGASPVERAVFSQYSGLAAIGDIRRAVITRRYKYIYDPDAEPELYDLEEDPLETKNLAADPAYKDIIAELHQAGKAWAESHDDWVEF